MNHPQIKALIPNLSSLSIPKSIKKNKIFNPLGIKPNVNQNAIKMKVPPKVMFTQSNPLNHSFVI